MKDKLILNDGTVIELETAASLAGLITIFPDWPSVAAVLPKLTEDNLASVQVQNSEGLTVGRYTDLIPEPGAWVKKEDGLYITISLREKTEVEKRLDNVEAEQATFNEGQETQNGAIAELAEIAGGEA